MDSNHRCSTEPLIYSQVPCHSANDASKNKQPGALRQPGCENLLRRRGARPWPAPASFSLPAPHETARKTCPPRISGKAPPVRAVCAHRPAWTTLRGPPEYRRCYLCFASVSWALRPYSFRSPACCNETDFNDCTLACRDAPCGCVTAPRFSLRGGTGSGISANAALPLFLRAFIEPCFTSLLLNSSSISLQASIERTPNTKRPGTFWVPGPLA
jgi:hypothetical protein